MELMGRKAIICGGGRRCTRRSGWRTAVVGFITREDVEQMLVSSSAIFARLCARNAGRDMMLSCGWCTEGTLVCYVCGDHSSNKLRACLDRAQQRDADWTAPSTLWSGNSTANCAGVVEVSPVRPTEPVPGARTLSHHQGDTEKIFKAARVKVASTRPRRPVRPTHGRSPQKKSRARL